MVDWSGGGAGAPQYESILACVAASLLIRSFLYFSFSFILA